MHLDECAIDVWQKFVLAYMVTILNLACVITCRYYRFPDLICGKNKTVICHQVRDLKLSVLELENKFKEFVTNIMESVLYVYIMGSLSVQVTSQLH